MDILLRPATPKDSAEIAAMSRDLIEMGLGWSWTPARVAASIRHRETMALVAEAQGRMVGFALMEFGDETAHLNLLAVRPRFQRRGIARRLVQWLEASCRTAGIQVVYLELRAVNRGARQFYQSLGYREIARVPRYYGGREMAIRMAHDLLCEVAPDR
jgi:ribosomal-protein-alanine N-acetyltransferase